MMLRRLPALLTLLLACPAYAEDDPAARIDVSFRYRLETVDLDGLAETATASTLKTRLTASVKTSPNIQLLGEIDNVSYLGSEDFNNLRNGHGQFPVVADPDGTHLNQLWVRGDYDNFTATLGRQRINLADQRFVGGVAWRQNEQTFDAVRFTSKPNSNGLKIDYSYASRVSRIFGPDDGAPASELDGDVHLLEINHNADGFGNIGAFYHATAFANAAALSTSTLGVRFSRQFQHNNWQLPLNLGYARQDNRDNNPVEYNAHYLQASLGLKQDKTAITVGFERLSGSSLPNRSFRTPLATLHKFQGWADVFLNTPAAGIDDLHVKAGWGPVRIAWHRFQAESTSLDYGTEVDASLNLILSKRASILLKVADYHADQFGSDVTKAWLMVTFKI